MKFSLFLFSFVFLSACVALPDTLDPADLEILENTLEETQSSSPDAVENTRTTYPRSDSYNSGPVDVVEEPEIQSEEMGIDNLPGLPSYPDGPYSLELFDVVPDMQFYNPWVDDWVALSDFFKHEKNKALVIVSSAGWCGPCLMEAAALIEVYEKYHFDGLEIIYTLGNTNVPGDVPFDTTLNDTNSIDFYSDLLFMENWQLMAQDEAKKVLNYQMYADPKREFIKYLPGHAWPLSLLITTKDMGIRLVEEGYWSALIENKITMVLYNDVPNIPFK